MRAVPASAAGVALLPGEVASGRHDPPLAVQEEKRRRAAQQLDDQPPLRLAVVPARQPELQRHNPVLILARKRRQCGAGELLIEKRGETVWRSLADPPARRQEMKEGQIRTDRDQEVVASARDEPDEVT